MRRVCKGEYIREKKMLSTIFYQSVRGLRFSENLGEIMTDYYFRGGIKGRSVKRGNTSYSLEVKTMPNTWDDISTGAGRMEQVSADVEAECHLERALVVNFSNR